MRKSRRPWVGAGLWGMALCLWGCSSSPEATDAALPPPENGPVLEAAQTPVIAHAALRDVEQRAERALGGAAGAAPDFEALARAAADLEAGLEQVRADRGAADVERYEQQAAELGEWVAALQRAAQSREALAARRAFHGVTAACVRCHVEFGAR